jgi:hypothetical protein
MIPLPNDEVTPPVTKMYLQLFMNETSLLEDNGLEDQETRTRWPNIVVDYMGYKSKVIYAPFETAFTQFSNTFQHGLNHQVYQWLYFQYPFLPR